MDLPLVHTGCDSYPSVYPQFKRFAQDYTPLEMAEKIRSLLPAKMGGKFGDHGKAIHVVFTGGEPLLWQDEIADVIKELVKYGLYDVTFETNGTVELNSYLSNVLKDFGITVTFSISPKLSASGESYEKAIKPEVIWSYYQHVRDTEDLFLSKAILKFVVAEESDLQEVERIALDYYKEIEDTLPVYLMPAGGCFEEYNALAPKVAQWAIDNGYKFSPRLHINIWGNAWAT
jgi:7-carboxy-7-deazaguanine synthase